MFAGIFGEHASISKRSRESEPDGSTLSYFQLHSASIVMTTYDLSIRMHRSHADPPRAGVVLEAHPSAGRIAVIFKTMCLILSHSGTGVVTTIKTKTNSLDGTLKRSGELAGGLSGMYCQGKDNSIRETQPRVK
jgi:hypothetical protein